MDVDASSVKSSRVSEQSQLNLVHLSSLAEHQKVSFETMKDNQNALGMGVDCIRNHLGGAAYSQNSLERLWSNVISSDEGSDAVQKQIDQAQDILRRASNPELSEEGAYGRELISRDAVNKLLNSVDGFRNGTFEGGEHLRKLEKL